MSDTPPSEDAGVERAPVSRNVIDLMGSQMVTWTLATLLAVTIPRFLGDATLGRFQLSSSLWAIAATITGIGSPQFLQLELARNRSDGFRIVGPTLLIRTVAFSVSCAAVATYLYFLHDSRQLAIITLMLGVGVFLQLCHEIFSTVFLGLERMSIPALATIASKSAFFVVAMTLLLLGFDVYGLVGASLAVALGGVVYLWSRYRQIATITFATWRSDVPRTIRGSLTFMFAVGALVLYRQIDVVVISWFAPDRDLGWYGAADILAGSLLFPATVLFSAIFPTMGRLHNDDPPALQRLIERSFALLMMAAVPIGLGTTMIAEDLAPLLYGEAFRETGPVLEVLGLVTVITFGTTLFAGVALATGRGALWAWVLVSAAVVTVPLDVVLVPWALDRFDNGAIGGAVAYVVTEALQFAIGLFVIVPYLKTRANLWRVTRIGAAGAVMMAVGWQFRDMFLAVPIMVSIVTYGIAAWAFRLFGDDERRMLDSVLERVGIRPRWSHD